MNIIGINAYHADSSACLLMDGKLISAVEEERFNRIKHWAGFPDKSIKYCLENSGLTLNDIDHISLNTNPNFNLLRKISYILLKKPSISFILDKIKNKNRRTDVKLELKRYFPNQEFNGKVHFIEHHLSHIASAHLNSNFTNSVGFSMDGFGDFSSSAWGTCIDKKINVDDRVHFPHSMGIFYQAMTQFLGFQNYGDEYKVMGLAPYGRPTFLNKLQQIVSLDENNKYELNLDFFVHHKKSTNFQWEDGKPFFLDLFNEEKIVDHLGIERRKNDQDIKQSHMDIAASTQALYEHIFLFMLNKIYDKYQISSLSLSGGCAMNSVANGKIYRNTKFKNIYIPASSGDAGGAIGSAFVVNYKCNSSLERFHKSSAYLGPKYDKDSISNTIKNYEKNFKSQGCDFVLQSDKSKLVNYTANSLSQGKVVGWFQGAMEWGPRALGNRSIIADPRNSNMKEILNSKIKRRESFRPFAPSILQEKTRDWFEEDYEVPFMMQVFQVKKEKRFLIPAVTHSDGSGRLQTVSKKSNEIYYDLICEFNAITGVPILLNTSFNENEPIVCKPEEAIECFLRTKMDLLVIENWLISRN